MNLRANPDSKFLLKYLLIGVGCLAFAAWSVYDGLVKFPGEIPRAQAWGEMLHKIEADPELSDADRSKTWKVISKENGWSAKPLEKDDSVEAIKHKIIYQYIFFGLGTVVGLPCLIWYLRTRNTWIESTKDGLRSSSGKELKLSQIHKFDKKKWAKKGIGVLHYTADDGSEKKFVVDDLKFDRKITDEIVRWVESHIPADAIVNGIPESALQDQNTDDTPPSDTEESSGD